MSIAMEIDFQDLELRSLCIGGNEDAKSLEADKVKLTVEEKAVLHRQLAKQENYPTPFRFLFNCATKFDLVLLVISLVVAVGSGLAFPISDLLLGNMGQSFRGFFVGETTLSKFDSQVTKFSLFFVYLAVGNLVTSFVSIVGFTYAGERIVQQVRQRYLQAILRQNVAFFDTIGVGEVNNCITNDTKLIQDAITIKACFLIAAFSNFCGAIAISFIKNWRLALILLPSIVLIILSMGIGAFFMITNSQKAQEASERGANIAQEAISSIATTLAFNMQSPLLRKFKKHADVARVYQFRSGVALGFMMAAMNAVIWWTYGFAFWEGSRLFVKGQVDISSILTVLFAILTGSFALGNVAPHGEAIVKGLTSTKKLSATIFRKSPLDPSSNEGGQIDDVRGDILLTNVRHVYPSRPDLLVMDSVNLHFPAGKTTAIVGPSGGGKSTIVGLLERFFEPVSGTIKIDGHDIASLNLTWLRQQIGLVSQEPTIFSTTVFENIRYGLIGTSYEHRPEDEIKELVERAAKKANAYDFILAMPEGFHSHVGGGGFLLSGGQKQRITIARAIVADPKILLLDEATSALDSKSERQVQAALDTAAFGRTTIVIAHRLSTIVNADNIVVVSAGRVVEQGTHQELLALKSAYYKLTEQQRCLTGDRKRNDETQDGYESAQEGLTLAEKRLSGKPLLGKLLIEDAPEDEERPVTNEIIVSSKKPTTFKELILFCYRLNRRMLLPICGGLFFSIIAGGSHPAQSVFMASVMQALSSPPSQFGHLRSEVNFWSSMYLMIGFTTIIGLLGQALCFVYYSEYLTYRARWRTFDAILHQDMATFFLPAHSTAKLSMLLSHSAAQLQGMGGVTAGTILIILTIIIAGIILAISVGWKLGLVCTSTIPILFAAGVMQLKSQAILEAQARKVHEASAHVACEYSTNIRTVAALTLEKKVMAEYRQVLDENRRTSLFLIAQSSLLFAFSQSAVFLSSALAFWYGSHLVAHDHYTIFQFYVCYTALIAGAYSAGAIFTFVPDMGKASAAAQSIKHFHERETLLDPRKEYGENAEAMVPSVQLKNVTFSYPNLRGKLVLDNVSLAVQPGQFIALVGASGSGKSTVVSLLERFFDVDAGSVMVGGKNIHDWNLRDYRNQLALVGQLPVLYEGTIRENIVLDSTAEVCESRIEQVCRDANIWDYIVSLPEGLETQVGPRGTLLSGGQKQRIAIARALLRDPKILLLDEATSALDSESERIVQAALDEAAQGRTTVAVAHRISTVQNADCIYVLDQGRVVESGTHKQLLSMKGRYHELVQLQNIEEL